MVIGFQRASSHGQQLVTQCRFRLVPKLLIEQRGSEIAAAPECFLVRSTEQSHPSGVDHALKDERFVEPPKVGEAASKTIFREEDGVLVARPTALTQSQTGLEHRKRFFG